MHSKRMLRLVANITLKILANQDLIKSTTCICGFPLRLDLFIHQIPCAGPEISVSGWGPWQLFLATNVFHRRQYGPPSRSIWTHWVQMLLEGDPYQYFLENL